MYILGKQARERMDDGLMFIYPALSLQSWKWFDSGGTSGSWDRPPDLDQRFRGREDPGAVRRKRDAHDHVHRYQSVKMLISPERYLNRNRSTLVHSSAPK